MIRALADYEKLSHLVVATEDAVGEALFAARPAAEALIARQLGEKSAAAGFALFFHTFSTFMGRRGLWLEDLYVYPEARGKGLGREFLNTLAGNRARSRLRPVRVGGPGLEYPRDRLLRGDGCNAAARLADCAGYRRRISPLRGRSGLKLAGSGPDGRAKSVRAATRDSAIMPPSLPSPKACGK